MLTPSRRGVAPKGVTVARLSPTATLTRPRNEAARRREGGIAVNHTHDVADAHPCSHKQLRHQVSLVAAVQAAGGHATTAQPRAS
uniref:Uncharacterized protein n=1 Tax=Setaria viridis TaxID=4556 RepID=A0A4U6WAJ8_SETVI|nr:hypothetical protein SEVIR_1G200233v2 [Setaria viridis]